MYPRKIMPLVELGIILILLLFKISGVERMCVPASEYILMVMFVSAVVLEEVSLAKSEAVA